MRVSHASTSTSTFGTCMYTPRSSPTSSFTVCDTEMVLLQADEPPRVLVLPKGASSEARICTLSNPRTLTPSRYYFDPANGLYEFTCVAAPQSVRRSWLIGRQTKLVNTIGDALPGKPLASEDEPEPEGAKANEEANDRPISKGYVMKNAEMLIATPIDYLFLLLPAFTYDLQSKPPTTKRLFLSADDLLEKLSERSKHFDYVSNHEQTRLAMEQRLRAVCDTLNAEEEEMYRLSDEKLFCELVLKAKSVVAKGLPASMEENFIRKDLETPVMVVKHEGSAVPDITMSQIDMTTSASSISEAIDSQNSTASAYSTAASLSTATDMTVPADVTPMMNASELYHLLRLRTALSYIISSYIPVRIAEPLNALISSGQSLLDFRMLDQRLADIAKMRAEALASRSFGDFSRKRSMYEDDDAAETRAENKRRKEEDEKKKKASESRGIKDLKKVDTRGMKKMSDFFGKVAAAKQK